VKEMNLLVITIPFQEMTTEEFSQYSSDPDVELIIDGDREVVVVKKQYAEEHTPPGSIYDL